MEWTSPGPLPLPLSFQALMSPESPAACPALSKAPARLLTPRITGAKSPCKGNLYSADFYELPSGLSRKLSVADLG